MPYASDLRYVFGVMLHPGKETARKIRPRQLLSIYYKFSIIPIVLLVLFGCLINLLGMTYNTITLIPFATAFYGLGALPAVIVSGIIGILVLVPAGAAIDALFYQLVGNNLLKAWKGEYSKTFNALLFSALPMLAGYFLLTIPVLNFLYIAIFFVWSFAVLIIALSSQHGIRRSDAFVVVAATLFIIVMLIMLITMGAALITYPKPLPAGYSRL